MGQRLGNGVAQFLSEVLVVGSMLIELMHWLLLRAGGWTVIRKTKLISGALCQTHGSSNLHFIQVTAPDNDVDNEVPVLGPGMHPRSLVHVTELEGICDGKTKF